MNKELMRAMGYGKYVDMVEQGKCPFCGINTKGMVFKNEISEKEFEISGLCQSCQDETFREQ